MSTCQEHLDWMRTMWEQMTDFVFENYEQFLTAHPSILVTDCKSLYDAIHKEGAAPASTDKRLAIEVDIVKAKAVSGVDARYQIADCSTKHASRKSETVLQTICRKQSGELLQKRTCWIDVNRRVVAYKRMTRW